MAPFYVYEAVAAAFDVEPGRLLGPDAVHLDASAEEMVLLRSLRSHGIEPAEAIARLLTPARRR
jgi:hypothetical protein